MRPRTTGRRRSTRVRRWPSGCGRARSTRSSASSTCSAPRAPLRRLVESDEPMSLVLYGPPGTGKTTLAHVISLATKRQFVQLSALDSGVKEVRAVITAAKRELTYAGRRTVLFIDEVHRFSKTQQDSLLSRGRGPDRQPDRRDHREPVLLRRQPAALPQPRAGPAAALRRRHPRGPAPRADQRARARRRGHAHRGGRGPPGAGGRRRRPQGADRPGVRRRARRSPRAPTCSTWRPWRRRWRRPRSATTGRATSTTTSPAR